MRCRLLLRVLLEELLLFAVRCLLKRSVLEIECMSARVDERQTLKRKNNDESGTVEPLMSTWDLIKAPGVDIVLFLYGHVMVLGLAYTASPSPLSFTLQKSTDPILSFSLPRILVYLPLLGRLRLHPSPNLLLPRGDRSLASNLAPRLLPTPPAPFRYRWYITSLSYGLAYLLY